jgi:hypothetical protein
MEEKPVYAEEVHLEVDPTQVKIPVPAYEN